MEKIGVDSSKQENYEIKEQMQAIRINDLTFKYPGTVNTALADVSFDVRAGELICLCGRTGSGKTTLMRCLKPVLAPHGERSGSIEFFGCGIDELSEREAAMRIGYVMQNPDNQIVTDKVWHELAFGLENIGMDPERIRIRVAEMATFFGIHNWFDRETDRLSGGQKQMLNLAAVMVMQPDLLLLDEPTASLDPVASADFFGMVSRISRELGTTIIVCEHRLDEMVPAADRLLVLDGGRVLKFGEPARVAMELISENHEMGKAMPAPLRAYAAVHNSNRIDYKNDKKDESEEFADELENRFEIRKDSLQYAEAPLDAGSGRRWLTGLIGQNGAGGSSDLGKCGEQKNESKDSSSRKQSKKEESVKYKGTEIDSNANYKGDNSEKFCKADDSGKSDQQESTLIAVKNAWFRYEKNGADILKGLSLDVNAGEVLCIFGGNGAGKSTLMKLLAAEARPYRGKVSFAGRNGPVISMLPQNPQLLFTEDTVRADLEEVSPAGSEASRIGFDQKNDYLQIDPEQEDFSEMVEKMQLTHLFGKHPYDLSGGEQQRAALAKVFLAGADVMLLDEPTKGLDEGFKEDLVRMLREMADCGKAVVITSHDIEFCARAADRCAMVFDGCINGEGPAREFFTGNGFYTTPCERMSRGILDGALFPEEIAEAVR